MQDQDNLDFIFSSSPPRILRLSRRLDGGEGSTFRQRALARWITIFCRRPALAEEYHLQAINDPFGVEIKFVAPRVLLGLTFQFETEKDFSRGTLQVLENGNWRDETISCTPSRPQGPSALSFGVKRISLTTRVRIFIQGLKPEDDFKVVVLVADYPYEDTQAIMEARREVEIAPAESAYLRGLQLAPRNGTAALELARMYFGRDELDKAERWSLTAAAYGDTKSATDLLQSIYNKNGTDIFAEVEKLRSQAAGWPGGERHGAVCLQQQQRYWLGFGSWYLVKHRSLIEIRRWAAARMFGRMQFQLTPHNEYLIFARLRILRQDDEIITLPDEHFIVVDNPEHNPAIRTTDKKDAFFFLPKLYHGDILELQYCLAHDNAMLEDEQPDFFIMTDLVSSFPTYRSIVRIDSPVAWPVKCMGIHKAATPTRTLTEDGWQIYTTEGSKLNPDDWGTTPYERTLHNPHICCSWDNRSWEDVGRHELQTVGVTVEPPDPLPEVLKEAIAGDGPTIRKLEQGFNWIRDRLKYMSLPSAKSRIAKQGRAQHIIDSGVGDCHDKAYLLYLVCRELNLETQFLLAGADTGFVVRELPGAQFDHILVRTRTNGDWLYLDATDTLTPFGHVPGSLQGYAALQLGDQVELVTIPEHAPETNTITISETLECSPAGDLHGQFEIVASGVPARWWDDRWKSFDMSAPDPRRAAQLILNEHMPSAQLERWVIENSTREECRFVFTGNHLRRRLKKIGARHVSHFDWEANFFPYETFRNRQWHGMAIFPMPLILTLSLAVKGGRHWEIEGTSNVAEFDADFGSVEEEQHRTPAMLRITRRLTIKKKFIRSPATERIPQFLKAFEDALQTAVLFRRIGQPPETQPDRIPAEEYKKHET